MSTNRPLPDIGLDFLHERCTECDGCLLWKGKMKDGPCSRIAGQDWKMRRLIWQLIHKQTLTPGWVIAPSCDHERCLHPEHLVRRPTGYYLVGIKRTAAHRSKCAAAKRSASDLSLEAVDDIRTSTEVLRVVAARHGISIGWAGRIRNGEAWRDYTGPFAQLLGAA